MSVEFTYDEEHNILYTRFFGVVINDDMRDQAKAVAADPRIKTGVRELVDLAGVEEIQGSSSSLEDNIRIDRAHSEKLAGMRTAIVASTDLMFGFARMYQTLAELQGSPLTVEVFRNVGDAREWLGIQDDEV